MLILGFAVILYTVPFLALAFLPGWRSWLLGTLAAAFTVGAATCLTLRIGVHTDMDGLAIAVFLMMIFIVAIGFLGGSLGRGAVLFSRASGLPRTWPALIMICVFLGVPTVAIGWYLIRS